MLTNPPEPGILEAPLMRVPGTRAIVMPATERITGRGTHTAAAVWTHYLVELLQPTEVRE